MPDNRTNKIWGKAGRGTSAVKKQITPAELKRREIALEKKHRAEERKAKRLEAARAKLRAKYRKDFRAFYADVICHKMTDRRTGESPALNLGKIHLLLIDFLNLNKKDTVRYTNLHTYLPPKNSDGEFVHERWLYWKTLDGEPEIEDVSINPDDETVSFGPLQKMFKEQFWQGLLIVVRADGLFKTLLIPRGFLKSSICTEAYTLWQIVREPDARHFMRSLTDSLAVNFVATIKRHFEANDKFRELYEHLGPPAKREALWSTQGIQVNQAPKGEKPSFYSRGKEWTVESYGMNSEVTGRHCDNAHLDDIVGATNTKTSTQRAKVCTSLEEMQSIPDPDAEFNNIGTRWEIDDAHGMTLDRKRSDLANYCSFLVATCVDGDSTVPCPKKISPLGFGKPLWPFFSIKALLKKRAGIRDDRHWFGQYFQQFTGTGLRIFAAGWVRDRYLGSGEKVAKDQKLRIYTFFDTASGKKEQQGKLDPTCGIVIGQTPDRRSFYLLDGFVEKLPGQLLGKAIVKLSQKWYDIAYGYNGSFWAGVETTAYTQLLDPLLEHEKRLAGLDRNVAIHGVSHRNEEKIARIRAMAPSFSEFRWNFPVRLDVKPWRDDLEPYDFMAQFMDQFENYPGWPNDDILDALAGAHYHTLPIDYAGEASASQPIVSGPYNRSDVKESDLNLHGYDEDGRYSMVSDDEGDR